MTALDTRPPESTAPPRRGGRRTRPRLLTEIALLAIGYLAYEATRAAAGGSRSAAVANARRVYRLEQRLHVDPEAWLDRVVNAHGVLARLAGYYYATAHFVVTAAVVVWLYWRRPERYVYQRRVLAATTFPALLVFWAFPVAPPRFALPRLTDTVAAWHILPVAAPRSGTSLANLDAAMPSLHVAWAAWCAIAVWQACRARYPRLSLLAFAYPALTGLVVLGTANHYLLDVAAGLAMLAAGSAVVRAGGAGPVR